MFLSIHLGNNITKYSVSSIMITTTTTTATSQIGDLNDIPNLKPPRETFVDQPKSPEDVNLEELIYDLQNGTKNVNNLHLYHSIFILSKTLQFIVKLQEHPNLYNEFRWQQLNRLGINEDDLIDKDTGNINENNERNDNASSTLFQPQPLHMTKDTDFANEMSNIRSNTPSLSPPPLKMAKFHKNSIINDNKYYDELETSIEARIVDDVEVDRDSSIRSPDDISTLNIPSPTNEFESVIDENIDDIKYFSDNNNNENNNNNNDEPPPYIPIEQLIQSTTITNQTYNDEQINEIYINKLKLEITNQHKNSQKKLESQLESLKIFNLLKTPNISIDQFLNRIKTYSSNISIISYLNTTFLLFKLSIYLNKITLNLNNSFRFLIGSLRCSIKIFEDIYQHQSKFNNVVGINNLPDLLKIELKFVYLINFNFNSNFNCFIIDQFLKLEFIQLCLFMKSNLPDDYNKIVNNVKS